MENSVVSFLRRAEGGRDLIFACNFTPVPRDVYRLGVPSVGRYRELLNSDAQFYGGSGVGNSGEVVASASSWHSQPASLELRLPPLGILVLQQVGD